MLRLSISAVLILATASAAGARGGKDPWPLTWDVSVYLCGNNLAFEESCPDGEAPPARIDAALATVAADPRITGATVTDRQEAADDFNDADRWSNAPEKEKTGFSLTFTAEDISPSIQADAVAEADPDELIEDFGEIPGVAVVYVFPHMYWTGRADVRVQMCGPATKEDLSCAGRGTATSAEQDTVADHLRALPGDPIVYEETPAHARWSYETLHAAAGPAVETDPDVDFTTVFWVDLKDTSGLTELFYRLVKLAGSPGRRPQLTCGP